MRLKRILIIGTIFPVLFSIVLFFGILISGEDDDSSNSYSPVYSGMNLSADVLKHQPMVEKYARENQPNVEKSRINRKKITVQKQVNQKQNRKTATKQPEKGRKK